MNDFPLNNIYKADNIYLHGLGELVNKLVDIKRLNINHSKRLYYYWLNNQKPINISDLKKFISYIQFSLVSREIKYLSAYASPHLIELPNKLDKELAYLTGYHIGDGHIRGDLLEINYTDSKEQLLRISKIYRRKFKINMKIKKDQYKNAFNGIITSKALASILYYCLDFPKGKKNRLTIPSWITEDLKKDFIIGFLDAEFGVNRSKFQFSGSSIDKNFILITQRILSELGLNLKVYGPYSSGNDPNPRWFLKTSKVKDLYWLDKNGFIRHPNHLKILKNYITNRGYAPVV